MELFGMEIQKRQDAYQLLALALRESRGLTRMPELDRRPGGKPIFLRGGAGIQSEPQRASGPLRFG